MNNDSTITIGDLTLDPYLQQVTRDGREVLLSRTEYELLGYLMACSPRPISKAELVRNIWIERGKEAVGENTVEVYVKYLREKLGKPNVIETRRGFGYRVTSK